jgi:hypothetical protein
MRTPIKPMRRLAVLALSACAAPLSAAAIELSAPVACPPGMLCPVQNLFDHDPGPAIRDFECKALGYDGHDGVDVRLPSMAAQRAGVEVKAAADGVVLGVRDGMADVGIAGAGREALKNVECGNGVMIRHDAEWSAQYCHMANGSIAVKKGDQVKRGQTIGRIGLSGMTEFPHLHFALRRNGKPVDPYAPDGPSPSCEKVKTAWTPEAEAAMRIDTPLTLNAGFSDGPVPAADIESGAVEARAPGRDPAALVAYSRVIGLGRGDGLRVTLRAPDGKELAKNEVPPAEKPKAQWAAFTGRKRPAEGWPAGTYRAVTEILRAGKPLKTSEVSVRIGG